jgi:hypothetical protein
MLEKSIIPKIIYNSLDHLIPPPISKVLSSIKMDKSVEKYKSPEQKGYDEHVQKVQKDKEDTRLKMDSLIKKSNRRIISINSFSFIPFGLFKDTIEVEESRVIFIFKQPFTFQSHTLDISDISNVFIQSAFLFTKMQIVSRTFVQNDITINYLNKHKAEEVRKIIEGLRTFALAKIDTSIYEIDELLQKIDELNNAR